MIYKSIYDRLEALEQAVGITDDGHRPVPEGTRGKIEFWVKDVLVEVVPFLFESNGRIPGAKFTVPEVKGLRKNDGVTCGISVSFDNDSEWPRVWFHNTKDIWATVGNDVTMAADARITVSY